MKHAHGEGPGAAGGVEDFHLVDRGDEGGDFGSFKGVLFLRVGKENVEPGTGVFFLHASLLHECAGEMGLERLVHHVVHDRARGVERAGLLAGSGLGFLVVGGEEVFEDFS